MNEQGVMEGVEGAYGVKGCSTCERLIGLHDDLGRAAETIREECQNETSSDESFEIADVAIRAVRKAADEVAALLDKHNEEAAILSIVRE